MFRVGQKIVCIRQPRSDIAKAWMAKGAVYPHRGGIYTVRSVDNWGDGRVLLLLEEVDNRSFAGVVSKIEPGFHAKHFRPIVNRKTSIEIFTRMLKPERVDA